MLNYNHGNGISMKNEKEFTELETHTSNINEFIKLSNKINELLEIIQNSSLDVSSLVLSSDKALDASSNASSLDVSFIINVEDPLIIYKTEQIINSFMKISLKVVNNELIIKCKDYKHNDNPDKCLLPHFLKLYWFIRNSLMIEIYKLSLECYKKTSNPVISFEKIEFIPNSLKNSK